MLNQFAYLFSDLKRWKCRQAKDFFYVALEPGVWATVLYRLARALYLIDVPVLKVFLRFISFLIYKFMELFLGVAISGSTEIGPGLYVGHTGLIRIVPQAKAGKNLSIGPGVFIAMKGLGTDGAPVLGDDVYIGVGAKILGPVRIGNNVRVGANAVVVSDVPDQATAVGIPARIIEKR